MDNWFLTGTTWKHNRTGGVQRVARLDDRTAVATLNDPAGRETSVTIGQLETLFTETDEPADLARFPDPTAIAIGFDLKPIDALTIGRLSLVVEAEPLAPLPDRRRHNNGSTRQGN